MCMPSVSKSGKWNSSETRLATIGQLSQSQGVAILPINEKKQYLIMIGYEENREQKNQVHKQIFPDLHN